MQNGRIRLLKPKYLFVSCCKFCVGNGKKLGFWRIDGWGRKACTWPTPDYIAYLKIITLQCMMIILSIFLL